MSNAMTKEKLYKILQSGKNVRPADLEKKYDIMQIIGRGSIAVVKKAIRKRDGVEVAVRVIKKTGLRDQLAEIVEEVRIQMRLRHPNIPGVLDVYDTQKKVYVVMELLDGGDLFDRIVAKNKLSEVEAAKITRSLALALNHMHERGIIHRDLKPENILFAEYCDSGTPKVCNFSLAKDRTNARFGTEIKSAAGDDDGNKVTTPCGTPGYVAPEILEQKSYDERIDIWSLGVITYSMLCGYPPFFHEKHAQLFELIKAGEYSFHDPYWTDISKGAKRLVSRMLQVNPRKRINIAGILKDPWLTKTLAEAKSPIK